MKNKKIAVIGLGYVGLPLAVEFAKIYHVLGFDLNKDRIAELNKGNDKTGEIDFETLNFVTELNKISNGIGLKFSSTINDLKTCDIFIITVPTPINQFKEPDLKPLISASEMVAKILKKGDLVIYEYSLSWLY